MGNPQTQLARTSGGSLSLDWQLGNLHRTELGPLNVGDTVVCLGQWGHWQRNQYLSLLQEIPFGAHSLWRNRLLNLDAGGGTWSCLK